MLAKKTEKLCGPHHPNTFLNPVSHPFSLSLGADSPSLTGQSYFHTCFLHTICQSRRADYNQPRRRRGEQTSTGSSRIIWKWGYMLMWPLPFLYGGPCCIPKHRAVKKNPLAVANRISV
ncbi:hypothetical protein GDO78_017667 [Eleutherodactylus coqui]|uniref:Uncharacterized protein n=1 Tax=Eleutherodactylus coqui TaxID=57060 RepID=A0A8J6EK68_ELECQ|nr:hypothetical protein GDO78_017667 [Eleutherodactylus coqui]